MFNLYWKRETPFVEEMFSVRPFPSPRKNHFVHEVIITWNLHILKYALFCLPFFVLQDRVLYRSNDESSIQPLMYSSCVSVKTSDHR